MISNKRGIGLEAEGFFLTPEGQATATITVDNTPIATSEYVLSELAKHYESLTPLVSPELVSVTLEIKSQVYTTFQEPIDEICRIQKIINDILIPYNTRLQFQPVITHPYEIIPSVQRRGGAISDTYISQSTRDRIHGMLEYFNYGLAHSSLYESTICSLQINDSRILQEHEPDLFEKLRTIYNTFSARIEDILAHNSSLKDFQGHTRMENYTHFLTGLKKEQFASRNVPAEQIIFPGHFSTKEELLRYFAAHANVDTFTQDTDSKSINGFLKYKASIGAAELRILDAQPTPILMKKACDTYEEICKKLM